MPIRNFSDKRCKVCWTRSVQGMARHLIWQGDNDQGFRVLGVHIVVAAVHSQPHPAAAKLLLGAVLEGLHDTWGINLAFALESSAILCLELLWSQTCGWL